MFTGVLVGCHIEILEASDKTLLHVDGEILNESKSMFTIESSNKRLLMIPKAAVKFALRERNPNVSRVFRGVEVLGTPQDRIRKD
jgi:RNase P/RNase MRP subunit p29